MDIVSIISSVSKIAVIAFVITLGVVIFEVVLLIRKNKAAHEKEQHVDIPDFDQSPHAEQHFTQIPEANLPQPARQIHVPQPLLMGVGVLTILLICGVGYWLYSRNKVSTMKKGEDISPVADSTQPTSVPTNQPTLRPSSTPIPTRIPTAGLSPTQPPATTGQPGSTASPTPSPTTGAVVIVTLPAGTLTPTSLTPTTMPSVTQSSSPSGTTKAGLPVAGTFQTTLILIVAALTLIYLAVIL